MRKESPVKIEWMFTNDLTEVARVHGGWLVKVLEPISPSDANRNTDYHIAMVFVPDPNHEWEMEELIGIHE
jgi:hypothetical protein